MLAVIGGSGLYELEAMEDVRREPISSSWGDASDLISRGRIGTTPVLFLPRHARGHSIAPHRINYRANLDGLRQAGATKIIAVAAVGGIAPECEPGALVLPHQLIDYTSGRGATFFERPGDPVTHVDFTYPYDPELRRQISEAALALRLPVIVGGVYGCTNGPRLETAAEIARLARDGCTLVGMTGMPEAILARELGMAYACLAVVVNPAAGLAPDGREVSVEEIHQTLARCTGIVGRLLVQLCSAASSSDSKSSRDRG